jgi:alanine racemase
VILRFSHRYQTLNLIKVSSLAIIKNWAYFKKLNPKVELAPVLKSNAYGHGLRLIGRLVDRELDAPFIVVDSLYEAWELRKAGVRTPLLLAGYTMPANFRTIKKLDFHLPVFDEATAAAVAYYQPRARLHIKIDSGMGRLGLRLDQVAGFIKVLRKYRLERQIVGIYSHLACADSDREFTKKQISVFKKAIRQFEQAGFSFAWKHIAATAGAVFIKDPEFNLVRLGLGLYGYLPGELTDNQDLGRLLEPALELSTRIIQVKEINRGDIVGYDGGFYAKRRMVIGILPVGYYDGLDRRLSNRGTVLIGRRHCPIIGKVCMNISMIDLTGVVNPNCGQEVIVISSDKKQKNSLAGLARLIGVTSYELLAGLSGDTRRALA